MKGYSWLQIHAFLIGNPLRTLYLGTLFTLKKYNSFEKESDTYGYLHGYRRVTNITNNYSVNLFHVNWSI